MSSIDHSSMRLGNITKVNLAHAIWKVETMPLIQLVEILIVVGVVLWLVNRYIPMQRTIKSILNAVVVICVVLWLLNVSGLLHSFAGIRVGK
jgi:cation transporter-like permease